jgi:hypothetical protein
MSSASSLADLAWQEVVELHDFFVAWMHGDESATDFSRAEASIGKEFRMISPDGKMDDRAAVLEWIKGARGSRPSPFTIVALDPRTIWAREDAVLLEYTEQQYRDGQTTRRRSTALFLADPAAPRGVVWRHLQETWMEGPEENA